MDSKIKAIIFDKDGTLFHYGDVWGTVISDSIKRGIPAKHLSEEKLDKCVSDLERITGVDRYGTSYKDGLLFRHKRKLGVVLKLLGVVIKYRMRPIKAFKAFASIGANPDCGLEEKLASYDFSKTIEAIEECHKKGYILGVVTHDKTNSASRFMKWIDPNGRISFIASGDGEFEKKPHPEAAHKFMDLFGLAANELCIVGDSITDMIFASNAKAGRKVALLSGSGDEKRLKKLSDVLYKDITEFLSDPVLFG